MRILVTADAVGGVWTYALDLARGLRAAGDDVALAVLGPSPSAAQQDAAREAVLELIDTGLPLDWTAEDAAELARAAQGLADLAAARRTQLLHLSSPALAGAATFAMPVVGIAHSCLATWWTALRGGPPPADFAWRIEATRRGYAACDALIAPSAAFAAATEAAYGVAPIPVHNGGGSARPAAAVRDIPIVTAGRLWDEGKGAATLDAAAAVLDAPVLALGPTTGPHGETVVLKRLVLAGARSAAEIAETLGRARIFVSAARYEPFGLSVLEAAQAGCALVLSDIPTFRELWEGPATFAPPGDADAFSATLNALLADAGKVERLAAAARAHAARYDLDRCVRATRAEHRGVLHARSTREAAA